MNKNKTTHLSRDASLPAEALHAPPNEGRRAMLRGIGLAVPSLAAMSLGGCAALGGAAKGDSTTELSATEVVGLIRSGDLSAETYASKLLDQCARYKGLNAFTYQNATKVLEQARAVDAARQSGQPLGRLAGLPMAIKDNIDTVGFASSAGAEGLKSNFPRANAPVVDKLFSQGALLLGKTNMHELALGATSSNHYFGFVHNPYDVRRVPGGSSGGTAAAIAARMAPAGLGTDTAGSVRIPASFCGIAGLRPTTYGGHLYPVDGVVPLEFELDTIGPLARTVADVALLDSVITGRPMPRPVDLREVRIGIPRTFYWEDLEPGVLSTLQQAMDRLRDHGVVFIDIDLGGLEKKARDLFFAMNASGFGRDLVTYLGGRNNGITYAQVVQYIAAADVRERFEKPAPKPSDDVMQKLRTQALPGMVREYEGIFKANGLSAIAFPTEPIVAPFILKNGDHVNDMMELNGRQVSRVVQLIRNTPGSGALGFPGINLPAGLSPEGMPVGLELDGLPRQDSAVLGLGMAMEKVLGALPAPKVAL